MHWNIKKEDKDSTFSKMKEKNRTHFAKSIAMDEHFFCDYDSVEQNIQIGFRHFFIRRLSIPQFLVCLPSYTTLYAITQLSYVPSNVPK